MPLVERCCLYEVPPVSTILRSPPRGVKTNVGRFQIVFNSSSPCLSWSPSRSFPVQSAGGLRIAARRARQWSISGSDLAMWPSPPLPLIQLRGLGKRCELHKRGLGQNTGRKRIRGYFEARKRFWWQFFCSFSGRVRNC